MPPINKTRTILAVVIAFGSVLCTPPANAGDTWQMIFSRFKGRPYKLHVVEVNESIINKRTVRLRNYITTTITTNDLCYAAVVMQGEDRIATLESDDLRHHYIRIYDFDGQLLMERTDFSPCGRNGVRWEEIDFCTLNHELIIKNQVMLGVWDVANDQFECRMLSSAHDPLTHSLGLIRCRPEQGDFLFSGDGLNNSEPKKSMSHIYSASLDLNDIKPIVEGEILAGVQGDTIISMSRLYGRSRIVDVTQNKELGNVDPNHQYGNVHQTSDDGRYAIKYTPPYLFFGKLILEEVGTSNQTHLIEPAGSTFRNWRIWPGHPAAQGKE
jgi:hypothetical protein